MFQMFLIASLHVHSAVAPPVCPGQEGARALRRWQSPQSLAVPLVQQEINKGPRVELAVDGQAAVLGIHAHVILVEFIYLRVGPSCAPEN